MDFLIANQWMIFILLETLSTISLLIFGAVRYFFDKKHFSRIFIFGFLFFLFLEAVLAFFIYKWTNEVSTFQFVIAIFLLYACTFGIHDFKKLDRWMRMKIGKWRGLDLLTEKEHYLIKRSKDPKYLAKKYRITSTIHLIIFFIAQVIFWSMGTENVTEMMAYLKDFSWVETGNYQDSPYPNEALYSVGMIWGIIFAVDFIWSWSYTFFPSKPK